MGRRWLPNLGRGAVHLELKDAASTQRAAAGRGFVYAGQPYVAPGGDIDRLVRDGYERVIWAYKAIDAIADKMSSWPIKVMDGQEPDWKQVTDDPILPLLNQYSNEIERSAKMFRYRAVTQLLLSKRGIFIEVIPDRAGRILALNLLPPGLTAPIPGTGPGGSGHVAKFRVETPGAKDPHIDLDVYDPKKHKGVVWIRKPHPTDPYSGLTPLEAAGISLDLDFYARLYNLNFLRNDGRAGQLVAVKGGLSPEDALELKARFSPGMGGAGRTTVIEAEGITVQDTAITPRDAQYAELRAITKEDLLIALGTPESVIGNASGRTFDNADAEKENWLDVTVLPLSSVFESGLDVLTRGGYEDERSVVHDVSGEPVLRRRAEMAIEKARADHTGGRITIDEFRRIASANGLELDELKRPGSRVLWIQSGMVPVGAEKDEEAAAAMLAQQATPVPDPMELDDGLAGFDEELDQIAAGGAASTGKLTEVGGGSGGALRAGKQLELESKAFNPKQPRYPAGHPQGGQFMDAGDTSLWLAGKPLKGGYASAPVVNPNVGSTASPALSTGGMGGAGRFTQHPDPKVRAAAAVITFPANYPYPRALGAPPAKPVATRGPGNKPVKVVSLRRGDVIADNQGVQWTIAEAKKAGTAIDLTMVDRDGNVQSVKLAGQTQLDAVARTPHPTVVAQAKRDVAAAAKALAAAPAAPTPAPAPTPTPTPTPAPAPARATPAPAPVVQGPPPAPAAAAPAGKPIHVPQPPFNATVYAHPQGKHIFVMPNGSIQVWKPDGKPGSSSATAAKLAAGHGSWVRVPSTLTNTSQHPANRGRSTVAAQQARSLQAAGLPPTPAAAPAPAPAVLPASVIPLPPSVARRGQGGGPVVTAVPAPAAAPAAAAPSRTVNVPTIQVDARWTVTGGQGGSNDAAMMRDPQGVEHYVKFQDDEHADNEVTAALLYQAAGIQTPTVRRAGIAPGVGKTSTGIASEKVPVVEDLATRMQRDANYRAKVHEGFAVHAWLANWDAMENNNTSTAPNGDPITIDVGGSLAFRARGGARVLPDTVGERATMRNASAGASARAAFASLTPDPSDRNFVAGVERIAAISPADIRQIVDTGMPSFTPRKRAEIADQLIKRRAYLAGEARVTLPENRTPAASVTPSPAPSPTPQVPTPAAPVAPAVPVAAASTPAPAAAGASSVITLPNGRTTTAQAVLVPPAGYPYGVVQGAPVATALPRMKSIKLASLRRGDVVDFNGVKITVDTIRGQQIRGVDDLGAGVTFTNNGPQVLAVARTPHPTIVAQARRIQAGPTAGPTIAPAAPAAPSAPAAPIGPPAPPAAVVVPTIPSNSPGAPAIAAVRQAGAPSPNGYAPVPGQTYASAGGNVYVIHSDGSGDFLIPGRAPIPVTAAQVESALQPGTTYRPIGPQPRTPTTNIRVGRHSTPAGDVIDVYPDGSGRLTVAAGGGQSDLNAASVDMLITQQGINAFGYDGPSPYHARQGNVAAASSMPPPTASSPYVGQLAPAGGWGPAGQIVPGASFTGQAGTLTVGPRGGGKLTKPNGTTTNMSAASLQSMLNRRRNQWVLQTPGPAALVAAPSSPGPSANPFVGMTSAQLPNGWTASGQILPGAVFTRGDGSVLTIKPNGDGTWNRVGGTGSRTIAASVVQSSLDDPNIQWTLTAAAPNAPTPANPSAHLGTPNPVVPTPKPAAAAGPTFKPQVGAKATDITGSGGVQPGQIFRNPKTGSSIRVNADFTGDLRIGPKGRGTAGRKSTAQMMRTLGSQGWVAESGPDIDTPGRDHARAVRQAAKGGALPPAGTPIQGVPPAGAVYPHAAAGTVSSTRAVDVARGQTVRTGSEDWIITEVVPSGSGAVLWGYRPGKDDPNTLTQEATGSKTWRQGVKLSSTGTMVNVDVVGPVAQPATNVPTSAQARPFDPSLGAAVTTPGVGSTHGPAFDVNSQRVNANTLTAGDAILIDGQEARGLFVVTRVGQDHKGRDAIYGYAATEADAADAVTPGSGDRNEHKLFLTNPSGTMRQTRVQVNGATPALPEVPRPRPPAAAGDDIERNPINDPTTKARLTQILANGRHSLPVLPNGTKNGDRILSHLMELRGYNALPDVLTEDEMDAAVADGEIEMWRGMTQRLSESPDVAEDYRSGKHYPGGDGGSQYGTGSYAAYGHHSGGQRDALTFVKGNYSHPNSPNGVMIRMTLKPEARIAEFDHLKAAFNSDRSPEATQLRALGLRPPAVLGHYAVLCGYDAIRKSHGYQTSHPDRTKDSWDDGFLVILNRSAVRVSEKNYVGRGYETDPKVPKGNAPPPLVQQNARHKMDSLRAKHGAPVEYRIVKEA